MLLVGYSWELGKRLRIAGTRLRLRRAAGRDAGRGGDCRATWPPGGNHINAERRFCRHIEGLKGPAIYAFVYFTLLLIAIDMTCFSNALSGIVRNLTSISSFDDSILYSLGGRL